MGLVKEEEKKAVERLIIFLSVALSISMIFCLAIPHGWHMKSTQIWTFYVGLFNVQVKMDSLAGGFLKGGLKTLAGKGRMEKMVEVLEPSDHSIQWYRDQFCNIELLATGIMNNCVVWNHLYWGSVAAAVGLIIAIVGLMTGATLMVLKPTRCIRLSALAILWAVPIVSLGGLGVYFALSFNFSDWLVNLYIANKVVTFSNIAILAALTSLGSILPPTLLMTCARMRSKEDDELAFGTDGMYYDPSMGPPPPGWDPNMGPPPPGWDPSMGYPSQGAPPSGPPPSGYNPYVSTGASDYPQQPQGGYGQPGYGASY